ncbi:ribonuclease domain-containing protein [Streptomyces sp. NRRL S-646]|uniref:ribonuclease domain-containing protein n=1 Tax=Streptomyces sp. NRRL S-646 TaxID=1463917 RepID=UPI0004CADED1|nr:ribonuclease domain-containing protein [Streptomyces sp. NRRL S-646]
MADWNAALDAANFWANHQIDWHQTDWSGGRSYYHLDQWAGRGWPGQTTGNQWFGYWESATRRTEFVYYGGTYNDWNGLVSYAEQNLRGVSTSRAFSSGNGRTAPYVEYDIDYYGAARSSRNARRIVRNPLTGNVVATFDHYQSFEYLGHF